MPFTFNPVLSEIQSHLSAMSPAARNAATTANPSLAMPPEAAAPPAPGMLLPPEPSQPVSLPSASGVPSLPSEAPKLITGPKSGQEMMSNGQNVPRGTLLGDTTERQRLLGEKPGVDNIYHDVTSSRLGEAHPLLGKLLGGAAEAGGIIGDNLANAFPKIGQEIPGTTANHKMLLGQANTNLGQDAENAQKEAQTSEDTATANKTNAETPEVAPEAEARIGLENAQAEGARNPFGKMADNEPLQNVDQLNKAMADRYQVLHPGVQAPPEFTLPAKATKGDFDRLDKLLTGEETASANAANRAESERLRQATLGLAYQNAADKNLWSVPQPDGSHKVVQLRPGDTVPKGAVSLSGQNTEDVAAGKPTADEQRRADLAENLRENFTQLRDIIGRRPELFGPLSGRWAELKQKFGTDDADLAALQTIEHQVGMAQVSAHGMRSSQGVQSAADSIMNHLHDGPRGILSALDAAEKSVGTFTGDVENKENPSGTQTSGKQNDPLGIR